MDETLTSMSEDFNLKAYPNPFSNSTTIYFNLNADQKLTFKLLDMTGRIVDIMEEKAYSKGVNSLDYYNPGLNAGVYLLSVENGTNIETKKLIVK
jgi:hypothetical protein